MYLIDSFLIVSSYLLEYFDCFCLAFSNT